MNRPSVKRQHERQIGSIAYMVTLPCCLEIDPPPIFKWQGSVTMYFNGDTAAAADAWCLTLDADAAAQGVYTLTSFP